MSVGYGINNDYYPEISIQEINIRIMKRVQDDIVLCSELDSRTLSGINLRGNDK